MLSKIWLGGGQKIFDWIKDQLHHLSAKEGPEHSMKK